MKDSLWLAIGKEPLLFNRAYTILLSTRQKYEAYLLFVCFWYKSIHCFWFFKQNFSSHLRNSIIGNFPYLQLWRQNNTFDIQYDCPYTHEADLCLGFIQYKCAGTYRYAYNVCTTRSLTIIQNQWQLENFGRNGDEQFGRGGNLSWKVLTNLTDLYWIQRVQVATFLDFSFLFFIFRSCFSSSQEF